MLNKRNTCKICGKAIPCAYTYCTACHYANVKYLDNTPRHRCKGCGVIMSTRYIYCVTCAKRRGFLKDNKDY